MALPRTVEIKFDAPPRFNQGRLELVHYRG